MSPHPRRLKRALWLAATALVVCSTTTHAALSSFSRANCGNNESISWDPWASHWLWVNSFHYRNGFYQHCDNNAGNGCRGYSWAYTWRAAAVHWGEGTSGGWYVVGDHYRWTSTLGTQYIKRSTAVDCNLSQW